MQWRAKTNLLGDLGRLMCREGRSILSRLPHVGDKICKCIRGVVHCHNISLQPDDPPIPLPLPLRINTAPHNNTPPILHNIAPKKPSRPGMHFARRSLQIRQRHDFRFAPAVAARIVAEGVANGVFDLGGFDDFGKAEGRFGLVGGGGELVGPDVGPVGLFVGG